MEFWRTINADTRYEVSNKGRVRNKRSGRILSTNPTKSHRHPQVFLMGNFWGRLQLTVSHLVWNAFKDDKISYVDGGVGQRVGHLDGDILNNNLENLFLH